MVRASWPGSGLGRSLVSCKARERESTHGSALALSNVRGEELGVAGGMWQRRFGMRSEDVERAQTYVCVTRAGL